MLWMLMLAGAALADEPPECESLVAVPGSFQVAWISPVRKGARSSTQLQVVRVGDLRSWVNQYGADQTRLLQGMGYVGPAGGRRVWAGRAEKDWKITIFDVQAEQICRPVEGVMAGADLMGAPVCGEELLRTVGRHESTCGYTLDRADDSRGLDTFRVSWEQAAAQGFCVFPLERFLEGA